MAEIIDLTELLRRKKIVAYLSQGIVLDLTEQLQEEFKFRLENFLCEFCKIETEQNLESGGYEVDELHLIQEGFHLMTLAFIDGTLTFLMPNEVTESHFSEYGALAMSVITFWEHFEEQIMFIVQELE